MISLIRKVDLAEEVFAELRRDKITETAALARLEVKIEQIKGDMKKFSVLHCEICKQIGVSDSNDLTVNLGSATDE